MMIKNNLILFYALITVFTINCNDLLAKLSYNLPNLSACAEWSHNGIIFTNEPMRTFIPYALFLDKNNILFVTNPTMGEVYKSLNGTDNFNTKMVNLEYAPLGLFVSTSGDIYTSISKSGRVDRWTEKTIDNAARFCITCVTIFISIEDVIYCSMIAGHEVVTKPLYDKSNLTTIVAGVGLQGSAKNMLRYPTGIFVDINLDLYVADTDNHCHVVRVDEFDKQLDLVNEIVYFETKKNISGTDIQ